MVYKILYDNEKQVNNRYSKSSYRTERLGPYKTSPSGNVIILCNHECIRVGTGLANRKSYTSNVIFLLILFSDKSYELERVYGKKISVHYEKCFFFFFNEGNRKKSLRKETRS